MILSSQGASNFLGDLNGTLEEAAVSKMGVES